MGHGDIVHVEFPVRDSERARRFYAALFGWKIVDVPGYEEYPMWAPARQGSGGGFAPRGRHADQPRPYVQVDSIDDTLSKVAATGGKVLMTRTPVGDDIFHGAFADPDGNCIGLYEGSFELPGH